MRADVESHAPFDQPRDECRVQRDVALRRHGLEARAVATLERDRVAFSHDRRDTIGLHVAQKI